MGSQPESSLLHLPYEVLLKIYQHFWTIPREEKYFFYSEYPVILKSTYLKAQLSEICTLGAICRTIRDEAYSEYFHTTQIYVGWGHDEDGFCNHDTERPWS